MSKFKRSSGILMPIFSLPSKYGIGTMGEAAYRFVDFLRAAGQSYWQILPLGHTGFGDSPYQTFSSAAGNPYFIDLDMLVKEGLISEKDLPAPQIDSTKVNYEELRNTRFKILYKAFLSGKNKLSHDLESFVYVNRSWLKDYAMFMSIKNHFQEKPLWEWKDAGIKKRNPDSLQLYGSMLKGNIDFYIFVQYLFFKQWNALKKYANAEGIQIIGDIPIYPSPDSSDVWVNPRFFNVDENLLPSGIGGVPPDMYSKTGQLWGNPTYNWNSLKADNFSWWIERIRNTLTFADVIRIDHFRGLCDYWEVPQGETTALKGKWKPGPKMELFRAIQKQLGDIPIIAEDLGRITDEVRDFLKETGYPGMRVLIFGLSADEDSMYLPHNWEQNSVGYTSTHDSETMMQKIWEISEEDRTFALNYLQSNLYSVTGMTAMNLLLSSPSSIVITPVQDILSLGKEGRINVPSTVGGNWCWRLTEHEFNTLCSLSNGIYCMTKTFKRI